MLQVLLAFGKAIEIANSIIDEHIEHVKSLRDYYENKIKEKIPNIKINGDKNNRLPGTSNISFNGIDGEAMLLNLDLKNIYASARKCLYIRFFKPITCIACNRVRPRTC